MLDDRDIRILETFESLGPDNPHVLKYHPSTDGFHDFDEVMDRIVVLEEAGYLRKRSSRDGAGTGLAEYEPVPGWESRAEASRIAVPSR